MNQPGFGSGKTNTNEAVEQLSLREAIMASDDLRTVYLWYDRATADERIKAIYYSSAKLKGVVQKHYTYDSSNVLLSATWVYPGKTTQADFGPEGGVLTGTDGISTIQVPAAVFTTPHTIQITVEENTSMALNPEGTHFFSAATFGPGGTVFNPPATLVVPLVKHLPPGSTYSLYTKDPFNGVWNNNGTVVVDSVGTTATVTTTYL